MLKIREIIDPSDDRLRFVTRLARLGPMLALAMGVFAISGLASNILQTVSGQPVAPGHGATHPMTALCLCILAIAMDLSKHSSRPKGSVRLLCLIAAVLAVVNYISSSLGLLHVFPTDIYRGRMAAESMAAVMFLSLSTGLRARLHIPGIIFLAGFLLLVLNRIVGLSFGVVHFGADMGPFTLASLSAASVLAVTNNANHPYVRVILLSSEVGVRTRVMACVGTFVPWAAGLFLYRLWGMPDGDFPIVALMITVIMGSTIILAIVSGYQHQIADELRQAAERRLVEQAITDGLTGLLNRAGITQVLRRRMSELKQTGRSAGIVMFDLDHFKTINDTHGHDEGDRVLVNVARVFIHLPDERILPKPP